jgi:hypothetical protein
MSAQPLKVDHGENGLYLSSADWYAQNINIWFNYYTNRAVGVMRPAALDGVFKFYSAGDFPLPPGSLAAPPWDGDPFQPRDLGRCNTDILELGDIPPRTTDANLRTVQEVPWTWANPRHTIRLTLQGVWAVDFTVDCPVPVPPLQLSGTWTLAQNYR